MPGGFEISQTIEAIRHTSEAKGYIILPLHGELPPRDQDAAVARYEQPKVVVATNVAETSITIDGVRLVIDSGLARIARYDSNRRPEPGTSARNACESNHYLIFRLSVTPSSLRSNCSENTGIRNRRSGAPWEC